MIFVISLSIIASDQLTKWIIAKKMLVHQSYPVIRNIFHITLVHNRGAAFGILKNQVPFFIFTALVTIALLYTTLKKHTRFSLPGVSLALILGGAVGNLIDRLFLGYVIDFLDFRVWPVFNIADSAITIGALLLAYSIFKESKPRLS